jgi:pimeloyl-ACP methyl ester carboxylesterase
MRKKLRGFKRNAIELDFDLYRINVPIRDAEGNLSVVDLHPEGIERTIIFVHGYAGCMETWEYQINHFSAQYRVIAPDLRGHGQSDAPYSQYTMAEISSTPSNFPKNLFWWDIPLVAPFALSMPPLIPNASKNSF